MVNLKDVFQNRTRHHLQVAQENIDCVSDMLCLTVPRQSFQSLINNKTPPGTLYERAVRSHAMDVAAPMAKALARQGIKNVAIVAIPRGGIPSGHGLKVACGKEGIHAALIQSRTKTDPDIMYDPWFDWNAYNTLIIADGVIGSGSTINAHLEQAPKPLQERIIVFSNVTSELGLKTVSQSARIKPAAFVTGHVIPEAHCEWVTLKSGKEVYFIGYNKERGIDYNLPDFGDAIQPQPNLSPAF
jgi:uracil phosphoribosyltransferase